MTWKDITSRSRGEIDTTPRTWRLNIGPFRLVVSRHIYYPPDVWLGSCDDLISQRELQSKDIDQAKAELVDMFKTRIEETSRELQQFLDQQE